MGDILQSAPLERPLPGSDDEALNDRDGRKAERLISRLTLLRHDVGWPRAARSVSSG
ncbi:hypothetical protein Q8W71_32360 [Methylobacterium sp. NEAU 140]|uniref:hypothetical protein n=1 Tax=Methylobacterium sp. NEAU 140 TaxID=3064945 RepID=UPI0027333A6A|nr:hypothetical protein [Methylobacterium sp. NEAU 140]MDP4027264.1 hypothetical protein [Methylobacterium sp. NEAU 140]